MQVCMKRKWGLLCPPPPLGAQLADYRMRKRKEFEDGIRRNRNACVPPPPRTNWTNPPPPGTHRTHIFLPPRTNRTHISLPPRTSRTHISLPPRTNRTRDAHLHARATAGCAGSGRTSRARC